MAETFREQLPKHARDVLIPSARERLHAEAGRARKLGAQVEESVLAGWPEEGINERAHRSQARLVVFGAPEFGVLARWLRGSVAEVVAESCTVPTLIVHSAAPFEKWTREDRPLRVLIAMDTDPVSEAALRWLASWRAMLPCDITIAHIDPAAGGHATLAAEARHSISGQLLEKARRILGFEPKLRVVASAGNPDDELIELAGADHADLLVVGTHQRHGLDRAWHHSVSRAVLRHAPMNVVCVPFCTAASGSSADTIPHQ
jgi:nucleotide-binding universal stress UspA family protein